MVLPPEVFSGASWPLTFSEEDVNAFELGSYLDNLKPRDELIKSSVCRLLGIVDLSQVDEDDPYKADLDGLRRMTIQAPAAHQIAKSLEAITEQEDVLCFEIVLDGLGNYIQARASGESAKFILRPPTKLQREVILGVPYEDLDNLEQFFDAVSLLARAGTDFLTRELARKYDLSVPVIDQQLRLIKEKQTSDWFRGWKSNNLNGISFS